MSLRKYRERLRILDRHIKTKSPGNINTLADKLRLSPSGAYTFLTEIKEEGFPIKYSKKENLFYYNPPGKMVGYAFVEDKEDSDNDGREKSGGG